MVMKYVNIYNACDPETKHLSGCLFFMMKLLLRNSNDQEVLGNSNDHSFTSNVHKLKVSFKTDLQ